MPSALGDVVWHILASWMMASSTWRRSISTRNHLKMITAALLWPVRLPRPTMVFFFTFPPRNFWFNPIFQRFFYKPDLCHPRVFFITNWCIGSFFFANQDAPGIFTLHCPPRLYLTQKIPVPNEFSILKESHNGNFSNQKSSN